MADGRAFDSTGRQLAALYRVVSELLLSPEQRRGDYVATQLFVLEGAATELAEPIDQFLASPRSLDVDEHLLILELTPPCPLYLGTYIFEEPQSCRGAGFSGRNGYMIELAGAYRHYGFELGKGELADFIPAMTEFLAISLEQPRKDGIGLRRRFVERYVKPGLKPMRAALAKYDSPYQLLIQALEAAVDTDITSHADDPLWREPDRVGKPPARPVITYSQKRSTAHVGEPS